MCLQQSYRVSDYLSTCIIQYVLFCIAVLVTTLSYFSTDLMEHIASDYTKTGSFMLGKLENSESFIL